MWQAYYLLISRESRHINQACGILTKFYTLLFLDAFPDPISIVLDVSHLFIHRLECCKLQNSNISKIKFHSKNPVYVLVWFCILVFVPMATGN